MKNKQKIVLIFLAICCLSGCVNSSTKVKEIKSIIKLDKALMDIILDKKALDNGDLHVFVKNSDFAILKINEGDTTQMYAMDFISDSIKKIPIEACEQVFFAEDTTIYTSKNNYIIEKNGTIENGKINDIARIEYIDIDGSNTVFIGSDGGSTLYEIHDDNYKVLTNSWANYMPKFYYGSTFLFSESDGHVYKLRMYDISSGDFTKEKEIENSIVSEYLPPINWVKDNKYYTLNIHDEEIKDVTKEYSAFVKNEKFAIESFNTTQLLKENVAVNFQNEKVNVVCGNLVIPNVVNIDYGEFKVYTFEIMDDEDIELRTFSF